MAIALVNPPASFVRFNESPEDHCVFGEIDLPLPVAYSTDVAFQFVLRGSTEGEASSIYGSTVNVGLVNDYGDTVPLIVFPFTAVRSKVSPTDILYNWGAGFPNFDSVISVDECFRVTIEVNGNRWWSNPFKRIAINEDLCWSSVIAYTNESGGFGFFGCGPVVGLPVWPGDVEPPVDEDGNCIPMYVEFGPGVSYVTIPITAEMVDRFGELPSVQIWIYDTNGVLTNMGIQAQFLGGYPPDSIYIDTGGPSAGVVRIGL